MAKEYRDQDWFSDLVYLADTHDDQASRWYSARLRAEGIPFRVQSIDHSDSDRRVRKQFRIFVPSAVFDAAYQAVGLAPESTTQRMDSPAPAYGE